MRYFKTLGAFGALALVVATLAVLIAGPASAAPGGTVNCADAPYNNAISGVVEGNVEITEYNTICVVSGTIMGNVTVKNESPACFAGFSPFVALSVEGGTIEGNVRSHGGKCVMIWLRDGATVEGNVVHDSLGNLGFLGVISGVDGGATVNGNVVVKAGHLWAKGDATHNRVDGHIICDGGEPRFPATGSETDWDGDNGPIGGDLGDPDGDIGKQYKC